TEARLGVVAAVRQPFLRRPRRVREGIVVGTGRRLREPRRRQTPACRGQQPCCPSFVHLTPQVPRPPTSARRLPSADLVVVTACNSAISERRQERAGCPIRRYHWAASGFQGGTERRRRVSPRWTMQDPAL